MRIEKDQKEPIRFGSALAWLWGSGIVLAVARTIQHGVWPVNDPTVLTLALVSLHAVVVSFALLVSGPPRMGLIFVGAYYARLITLLIERLGTQDLPFLSNGGDADGFYLAATTISNDLTLAGEIYGGAYTGILGYLFYFVGPDRLIGQYVNVLLGVTTVILIAKTLQYLGVSSRVIQIAIMLAAFMPMLVVHSAILLRETIIQVLIAAALLCFIKGLVESKLKWVVGAVLWIFCASIFHAGVLGVVIGFSVVSAFTYKRQGMFTVGLKRIGPVLMFTVAAVVLLLRFPDLFLGKFQSLESAEDLLEVGHNTRGGAAYLSGLEVNSWLEFVLYAPLRAFYFIGSPLPWDWRGMEDALAFSLDSLVYLTIVALFLTRKIGDPNMRYLARVLVLVLVITCLVFGVGVSNAGTALRHRGKLISIFVVLLAVIFEGAGQRPIRHLRARRRHWNRTTMRPEAGQTHNI